MIAWWIAQLVLLGGLLSVAALGAESALTVARRQTRWVWVAAMGLTVTLGALAPIRLAQSAGRTTLVTVNTIYVAGEPAVRFEGDWRYALRTAWYDATTALALQVQRAWRAWHAVMPADTDRALTVAWAAASLLLLVAFVAVHVRYQRRRRQWPVADVQGTRVRIAADTGPAVIGVTSAEIVVPQWLLARDASEQRLVLQHELEHVRQHDPLLLAVAQAAVILLPWNPALWWMASRLRLAIELDCDRRVLQRGASARAYGSLLIDLTDHRTGFGAALPAFSCTPSHLERRLVAMTPTRLKYPLIRALATGAVASLALLAACEAKLPTSDDVTNMTARTATTAAGQMAILDTANVVYFVNNQPTSKAQAKKLAAEQIATVNVTKRGAQGGEVRIVTRDGSKLGAEARAATGAQQPTAVTFQTRGDSITVTADTKELHDGRKADPVFLTGVKRADESKQQPFNGLLIVDGVITDASAMKSIAPDQILTVDVIKGIAATQQYSDPRAANGVIKIATKKAKQ